MKSLSLSTPHVLILVGIPGAGKTYFAHQFAQTFGAPYVSDRAVRHKLVSQPQYGKAENQTVATLIDDQLNELLKTRSTIIYEGNTDSRTDRTLLTRKVRKSGYEPLFVWVQTDPQTAKQRSTKASKNRTYAPIGDDIYERRLKRFSAPHASENVLVISGKHTYATQAKAVLKRLSDGHDRPVEEKKNTHTPTLPALRNAIRVD